MRRSVSSSGIGGGSNDDYMLYEDHVVDAVCAHLETEGWTIKSRAYAHQRGDDIVATRDGAILRVEAKGGGSSKEGTKRYGEPFKLGQCHTSACKASFRALGVVSAGEQAAVAFPDTPNYRRVLGPVMPALIAQAITVYLVGEDRSVTTLTADYHCVSMARAQKLAAR
jgi:hypothetical protein